MDKVAETILKTIVVLEEMGDKTSAGVCYANLAGIYLQMGSEGQAEKVDEAEANFKKALEVIGILTNAETHTCLEVWEISISTKTSST